VVTPKKQGFMQTNSPTNGSAKKPVHDLLHERIAKKNQNQLSGVKSVPLNQLSSDESATAITSINSNKSAACKRIDFSDLSPTAAAQLTSGDTKVNYMTGLGLLQRSNKGSKISSVKSSVGRDSSKADETEGVVSCEDSCQVEDQENEIMTECRRTSTEPSDLMNGPIAVSKSPSKSKNSFPKIKPMKITKKSPKKSPSLKNNKSASLKLGQGQKDGGRGQNPVVSGRRTSQNIIVIEPVDQPSLGPYSQQPMQTPDTLVIGELTELNIKEEVMEPLNYSLKEYDSLRELATLYSNNTSV
jgi:hypothetical protein